MSNKNRIARLAEQVDSKVNVVKPLALQLLSTTMGFALSILSARFFGPEIKGYFELINTTAMLILTHMTSGLSALIALAIARNKLVFHKIKNYVLPIFTIIILLSILVSSALPESLTLVFLPPTHELKILLLVTLIGQFLVQFFTAAATGANLLLEIRTNEALVKLFSMIAIVGLFISIEIFNINLIQQLALYQILPLAVSIVFLAKVIAKNFTIIRPSTTPRVQEIVPNWMSFVFTSQLGNILQFWNYKLSIYVINGKAGVAEVGFYSLAFSLAQIIWLPSQNIAIQVMTETARDNQLSVHIYNRIKFVFFLGVVIAIMLYAGLYLFIEPIFGSNFRPVLGYARTIFIGFTAFTVANVAASAFAGLAMSKLNLFIALLSLAVNAITIKVLSTHSSKGEVAATAGAIAMIFSSICYLVVLRRHKSKQ